MITALKLLKEARKLGWFFAVDQGDEDDGPVITTSPVRAWELVKEVDEANVTFFNGDGAQQGVAYLMAPSSITCSDEETLVDYSCSGGEFEALCYRMIEEAE